MSYDPDDTATRLAELTELVVSGLGAKLDQPTFEQLADIQLQLREEQRVLAGRLMSGEITRQVYMDLFASLTFAVNKQSEVLLGRKRFKEIFGDPDLAGQLVDRDAFLSAPLPRPNQVR